MGTSSQLPVGAEADRTSRKVERVDSRGVKMPELDTPATDTWTAEAQLKVRVAQEDANTTPPATVLPTVLSIKAVTRQLVVVAEAATTAAERAAAEL